jgi:folate-binding protein YgfZ
MPTPPSDIAPSANQTAPLQALSVNGPEARDFLNRLVISDLSQPARLPFSGICNPKGRLLYTFWLLPQGENKYLLFTDPALRNELIDFLNQRRFRTQVAIEPAPAWQMNYAGQLPDSLTLTAQEMPEPADFTDHEWRDYWLWLMRNHLPWIQPATQALFIPQQLDLHRHGVVSVDKGCYPGQEIIARLHFLGKNKKHLYHCQLRDETANRAAENTQLPSEAIPVNAGEILQNGDCTTDYQCASPAVADDNGQIHLQLVGTQPPESVLINGTTRRVSASRPSIVKKD